MQGRGGLGHGGGLVGFEVHSNRAMEEVRILRDDFETHQNELSADVYYVEIIGEN